MMFLKIFEKRGGNYFQKIFKWSPWDPSSGGTHFWPIWWCSPTTRGSKGSLMWFLKKMTFFICKKAIFYNIHLNDSSEFLGVGELIFDLFDDVPTTRGSKGLIMWISKKMTLLLCKKAIFRNIHLKNQSATLVVGELIFDLLDDVPPLLEAHRDH